MRLSAALAVTSVLMATSVQAQTPHRIAEFLTAVETAGCVINETNNQAILQHLAMTEDEGTRIVMVLMSDGRAVPQDDDLRITTGTCN